MAATSRLPKPVSEAWHWQLHAACRDVNVSRFFHPENERGTARDSREERAKLICARCPVVRQCREHALKSREPYGIWGGLGERERRELIDRGRVA